MEANKYWHNLLAMPAVLVMFLVGVLSVLVFVPITPNVSIINSV